MLKNKSMFFINNKIIASFSLLLVCSVQLFAQDIEQMKKEKLAAVSGTIGASTTVYAASGIAARRVPFSWMAYANATVKLKGIDLPFSFILTEQNRDFRQPFNQFGMSPKYKNLQLHLGWRNLQYSNYTLNGHTFLGAGLDYKINKISIGAMYGRFLKAVADDSAKTILNSGSQLPFAVYNRTGYAVKLGYGSDKNNVSLIFLKARDAANSLAAKPKKEIVAPAENAVLGIKTKLSFLQHFEWNLDAAISGYTRDTRSAAYPTDEEPLLKKLNNILPITLSTAFFYAGESSFGYNSKQYGLKVKYQRILPDYKSMGMYFIQTDVDRKTIEGRVSNTKNTLNINGSIGLEKDNLTNRKLATSNRSIGSLNINYNPKPAYGISVTYMNYGTTQSPGLKSISDTVRLDQVTNSIIIVPRYTLTKTNAVHNMVLNLSRQALNDRNKFNSTNYEMQVSNATLTYVLTLLKSNYSFDLSPFYVQSKFSAGTTMSMGGNVGVSKTFLKNKLSTGLSGAYSTNTFNNDNNGYTLQARLNGTYRMNKHHKLQLQLIHVINESKAVVVSKSFNESTGILQYSYTF
jgi:hypothetical protein